MGGSRPRSSHNAAMNGAPKVLVVRGVGFVGGTGRCSSGWRSGPFAARPSPVGFDFDLSGLACEPVAIAAPWPVFGIFDESAGDGIAVNVAKLLDEFGLGEDVEVVVIELPEAGPFAFELFRCPGFECAEDGAQAGLWWFAE